MCYMTYKRNELSTLILIIMKKILLITFVIASMTSCITSIPPRTNIYYADYAVFNENGIFATELSSVNFDYETLGSILVEMREGLTKQKNIETKSDRKSEDDLYSSQKSKYSYTHVIPEDIYQKVCDEIKSRGGNAIVNMKVIYLPANEKKMQLEGWSISGMVIRK